MKVLGIVGSLRRDSYNAQLLRAAEQLLPGDVELVTFDELKSIPAYDSDLEDEMPNPSVVALKRAIAEADAVLFATPEYNGSIPGFLKNALDWVSRPIEHNVLRNKPVAVIGTSTGMFGAVWAQAELRRVLGLMGARVLDRDTPVPLAESAFAGGELIDEDAREAVRITAAELFDLVSERRRLAAAA